MHKVENYDSGCSLQQPGSSFYSETGGKHLYDGITPLRGEVWSNKTS